jgi:hypothetical protein
MTHTPDPDTAALAEEQPAVPRRLVFHQIRMAVYRLAVTTTAGELTPSGRSFITRPPLLTDLRDAVRPNQGGTGAGGSSPAARIGFDAGAYDLYTEITTQIASAYETATERQPTDTPEMMLLEWFIELEAMGRIKDGLSDAQLLNQRDRARSWQTRIEHHFNPPRTGELPGAECIACKEKQGSIVIDGHEVPAPAIFWTKPTDGDFTVHCRVCFATWSGEDLELLDRFRWTQRRAARLADLTTPLVADAKPNKRGKHADRVDVSDWRHIRLELRDAATKTTARTLWLNTARRPAPTTTEKTDAS